MLKLGIGILSLFVAACGVTSPEDDARRFARDKADMLAKMKAEGFRSNPTLLCAAKRVSNDTAQTLYLIWIHERGDLTTQAQRTDSSRDSVESIEACGGNIEAIAADLERHGDDVPKGLALALLEAGR